MARVSPHKIPVDFGSADESTETMTFVLSLSGISEASAAQVAVLGILAARHVERCGKRPVLNEAVKILARPGRSCAEMFEYIQNSDMNGLTRNTRSFMLNTCKAMLMCDPVALRNSVANAVMVLTSESLRRSMEEEPGADLQEGLDDDGLTDEEKAEAEAAQAAAKAAEAAKKDAKASEVVKRRAKPVEQGVVAPQEKPVETAEPASVESSQTSEEVVQGEPASQNAEPVSQEQEPADATPEVEGVDPGLAAVLEGEEFDEDTAVILTNDDFGAEADPVFGESESVVVESQNVVTETVQHNVAPAAEAANDNVEKPPVRRFGFKRSN